MNTHDDNKGLTNEYLLSPPTLIPAIFRLSGRTFICEPIDLAENLSVEVEGVDLKVQEWPGLGDGLDPRVRFELEAQRDDS